MAELVDIIIPVYNGCKYIKTFIYSLKKQSYTYWNAIFVDDGSIDGTASLLDEFVNNDPRMIVVHHSTNKGSIAARVTGIKNSKAKWIMFADIDDMMEPNMIQSMLILQQQYHAEIVCCGRNTLSKHGWICRKKSNSKGIAEYYGHEITPYFCGGGIIHSEMWGKLYLSEVIHSKIKAIEALPNIFWGDDSMINVLLFKDANKIVVTGEAFYNYRYGGGSLKNSQKRMEDLAALYDWRKRFLLEIDSEEKHLTNNLCQVLNAAIYYAHYSEIPVKHAECCRCLTHVIDDIDRYCPGYKRKEAFLSDNMTDKEFANVYKENLLVKIKGFMLKIF